MAKHKKPTNDIPSALQWEEVEISILCDDCEHGSLHPSRKPNAEATYLRELGFDEEAEAVEFGWLP